MNRVSNQRESMVEGISGHTEGWHRGQEVGGRAKGPAQAEGLGSPPTPRSLTATLTTQRPYSPRCTKHFSSTVISDYHFEEKETKTQDKSLPGATATGKESAKPNGHLVMTTKHGALYHVQLSPSGWEKPTCFKVYMSTSEHILKVG